MLYELIFLFVISYDIKQITITIGHEQIMGEQVYEYLEVGIVDISDYLLLTDQDEDLFV